LLAITRELGWIDLWFRLDGTGGYADLVERATTVEIGDVRVRVAGIDDVLRSKEASGRQKDLERLPHLRDLRREVEARRRTDPSG
jgi:predicted nucleotidyltransferase